MELKLTDLEEAILVGVNFGKDDISSVVKLLSMHMLYNDSQDMNSSSR